MPNITYFGWTTAPTGLAPADLTALYWRIMVTGVPAGNDGYTGMDEIQFRTVKGVAENVADSATLMSSTPYFGAQSAQKAFNNTPSDVWLPTYSAGVDCWCMAKFAAQKVVRQLAVSITGLETNRWPQQFKLQKSDDNSVWTTVFTKNKGSDFTNWTNGQFLLFDVP